MKKIILKKIRPLYEYIKTKPYLAHFPLSLIEYYNDFVSNRYQKNSFASTMHHNCDDHPQKGLHELDIITVAFNNASLIENQINFLQKNLIDSFFFTVADNSNNMQASNEIRQICKIKNVGYIRLPINPWKQANLSHSIVLNWLYNNYIKPRKIKYFGFIDHDIFLLKKTSILEKFTNEKLMYGLIQERPAQNKVLWYLWAGFCFYKNDILKDKKVNFSSSIITSFRNIFELDTGGKNWKYLYKDIDRRKVSSALPHSEDGFQKIDDWVHLAKASFKDPSEIEMLLNNLNKQTV